MSASGTRGLRRDDRDWTVEWPTAEPECEDNVDYQGAIFRPPSEAHSLLVQVTVGCSHSRCSFCSMFRDKHFRTKPWAVVEADLREAAAAGPRWDRAFLCDGDALVLSTGRLLRILDGIRQHLPWIRRVGVYGNPRSLRRKGQGDLERLRRAGLGIVYHGMESGDPEVLRRVGKASGPQECVEMAARLREAGVAHSVMVLLGLGGVRRSAAHAQRSAEVLGRMDPPFGAALTVTLQPGTPLYAEAAAGDFVLPDRFGLLSELRCLVAEAPLTACRFSSNHASNYLPIRATLPTDRAATLAALDQILASRDERHLRPEFLRGL